MQTAKEYLIEQGVKKEVAVECEEIITALRYRIKRFGRTGLDRSQILMDMGRYRHTESRAVRTDAEVMRLLLDISLLVARFPDRFRILEHYDVLTFNLKSGEYQFTEFGTRFLEAGPVV